MQVELQALEENNTWDIVKLPRGRKTVGCRWVFKNKYNSISQLKSLLHQKFSIKDLGILKYFLGLEVAYSKKGIFLNQRKYVLDLLQETGKSGVVPADTPVDTKAKLDETGDLLSDVGQYQRLVGRLIYLTITRPDITYAVSLVSRFMHAPRRQHMDAVTRILRYLKGSPGRGIWMRNNGHHSISAYTDADWAGCPVDRKSTSGYCIFVGGNLVTWKSKKQNVVARSSAEAEYRAMATTTSEIIWLRVLLKNLGFGSSQPIILYCDNQAAMHIASNPVFHERTKHIEFFCHFVREKSPSFTDFLSHFTNFVFSFRRISFMYSTASSHCGVSLFHCPLVMSQNFLGISRASRVIVADISFT
ncbi:hypothetical protein ACHQM5_029711 [Ranunculus cassubicifolius]